MMACTPLLRFFARLSRDHAIARANSIPPRAFADLRAASRANAAALRLHRRAFLAAAAAAAAELALPRSARARADNTNKTPRIAIVGAGVAGLACALDLADHGVPATVYEASDRVGGRMFSNTDTFDGQVAEWCGELIDTDNLVLHRLAARFGLTMDDLASGEPENSEPTYHFDGAYYPAAQADADFTAVYDAIAADYAAAGSLLAGRSAPGSDPGATGVLTSAGRALDAMSVHAWIDARIPGGHRSPLGKLLDVAYVIQHGADTRDQSALGILHFLGRQPPSVPPPLMLFGASDERYHVRGGNQQIPEAIARVLGDAVVRDHRLVRIAGTPAGRMALTFAPSSARSAVVVTADIVVLAIPFAVLAEVDWTDAGFDARKARAINDLGRAHNGKTQVEMSDRVWTRRGPWPGVGNGTSYADTGYQNTWEASRAQTANRSILVLYTGGPITDSLSATSSFATSALAAVSNDARTLLERAERVFPGLGARWTGNAIQSLPHLGELRRASYCYRRVGQYTAFAGHEGARQGNVLFAGEHTSLTHPAHMEGAAREGLRAAREIREQLSLSPHRTEERP